MSAAITVSGISKCYQVRHDQTRNLWITTGLLQGAAKLGRRVLMPWRYGRSPTDTTTEDLWSLNDVSFEVKRGEVVGIIGNNGAGKTTLLRVLSGITEPTRGRAVIRGRLLSLLELGIGFKGDLTGRENIYLNAAIQGMSRPSVARLFDEIVAFAGTEQFLDTPLKWYSSGMRSRLAFSINMVLEHDIIIIDEALATGDVNFRSRALERIRKSMKSGVTTLLVSHDLGSIRDYCPRTLWLDGGRLAGDGPTNEVIDRYLQKSAAASGKPAAAPTVVAGNGGAAAVRVFAEGETRHLRRMRMLGEDGVATARFAPGKRFGVELDVRAVGGMADLEARIVVSNAQGQRMFRFRSAMLGHALAVPDSGEILVRAGIEALPLTPGQYMLGVEIGRGTNLLEEVTHALPFEVVAADPYGHGASFVGADGLMWVRGAWESSPAGEPRSWDGA